VPRDAARLTFDQRSRHVGGDGAQEVLDAGHPREIDVEERAPVTAGWPGEVPVLGAEVDRELAQPRLERFARSATDDVNLCFRQIAEGLENGQDLGGRRGQVRMARQFAKCPVVVE